MILVVDSSALALLINPAANPPDDPDTKRPVEHARERIEFFTAGLTAADTLVVPTPVLAEALVRAGDGGPGILEALTGQARLRVRPFGERAAVETAMMTREALAAGDKRSGSEAPWQKVKFDRQVIAIARVEGATAIYADDRDLVAFARGVGLEAFSTWELPPPPPAPPVDLFSLADMNEATRAGDVGDHSDRSEPVVAKQDGDEAAQTQESPRPAEAERGQ